MCVRNGIKVLNLDVNDKNMLFTYLDTDKNDEEDDDDDNDDLEDLDLNQLTEEENSVENIDNIDNFENIENLNSIELDFETNLKAINISTLEEKSVEVIDYKKLSLNKLKSLVLDKGLATDTSKMKKLDLLKLLGIE